MYKDRWKTRIDAGRRRKPDSIVKRYGTTENILKGVGVAALVGVLGFYVRHVKLESLIAKLKGKPEEAEMSQFSL
ncbi:MAG TPA: hypothetical protein VF691_16570 [Cytophagaceae bacterium]|jgi:hypothetical protein